MAPMWANYKPERDNGHAAEAHIPIDTIDGHNMEKAVFELPEKHRAAIRWHYCFFYISPGKTQRALGVTRSGLMDLIHDGRSMLTNRAR